MLSFFDLQGDQRFINTESRHWERHVCSERRELLLSQTQDDGRKFIIHTKAKPARKTPRVTLLFVGSDVHGLYNETTGKSVNYIRDASAYLTKG